MINYKMERKTMIKSINYFNLRILTLITAMTFLSVIPSIPAFAQESEIVAASNNIIDTLDFQIQKIGKLKLKISKLQLTAKSNKYAVQKNEMQNMHAVNQFIAVALLTVNVTNDIDEILQHLKIMANKNKLIQNNDTRNNLQELIRNSESMITGLNGLIINLEESQKIFNGHNSE